MAREGRAGPKYRQIAGELRAAIESGEYPPGSQLPTKAALMEQYQVALNTIDSALEVLRRAGLAESHQGSGTFVLAAPERNGDGEMPRWAHKMHEDVAVLKAQVAELQSQRTIRQPQRKQERGNEQSG